MSKDIECPYCGAEQDICHDDGYGCEEGKTHQQECSNCEKTFGYATTISFYYEGLELPCANGGEHKWEPTITWPKSYTRMCCKFCKRFRAAEWIKPTKRVYREFMREIGRPVN